MKIVLALIGLQLAVCVGQLPTVNLNNFCDGKEDGYHCASCLQPVYCNATDIPPATELQTCNAYEACEAFSPTLATCVTRSLSVTFCKCIDLNNDYMCDSYNEHYRDSCERNNLYINDVSPCDELLKRVCRAGLCVDGPSCSGSANGTWGRYYPVCYMGYQCELDQVVEEKTCEDNEYLSNDGNCLTYPPVPCSNNCEGNCPDETDCSQYYFCDGLGDILGGPYKCPDYSYFNPHGNPPTCVPDDSSVCAPLTACEF